MPTGMSLIVKTIARLVAGFITLFVLMQTPVTDRSLLKPVLSAFSVPNLTITRFLSRLATRFSTSSPWHAARRAAAPPPR